MKVNTGLVLKNIIVYNSSIYIVLTIIYSSKNIYLKTLANRATFGLGKQAIAHSPASGYDNNGILVLLHIICVESTSNCKLY